MTAVISVTPMITGKSMYWIDLT
ncbi:uncharacterized protein METZ01_LOCUS214246, partial [marine metagenome]